MIRVNILLHAILGKNSKDEQIVEYFAERTRDFPPVVMCTNRYNFEEGETVAINCGVHSSNAMITSRELKARWTKVKFSLLTHLLSSEMIFYALLKSMQLTVNQGVGWVTGEAQVSPKI